MVAFNAACLWCRGSQCEDVVFIGFIQKLFYSGCLFFFPNHKHSSLLCSSKAMLSDMNRECFTINSFFTLFRKFCSDINFFFSSQTGRQTFQYVLSSWLSHCQVHFLISVPLPLISLQYFWLTPLVKSPVLQANPLFLKYAIIIQFTAMPPCTYLNFNHQHGRACSQIVQALAAHFI